jgi:hypothetical protein
VLLFDALSHFEESLLAAKLAAAGDDDGELRLYQLLCFFQLFS